MATYKYGDVPDSVIKKTVTDFLSIAEDTPPLMLAYVISTLVASLGKTKQESVNILDTITRGLTRG